MNTRLNHLQITSDDIKRNPFYLGNSGILFDKVPNFIFQELGEEVERVRNNFDNLEDINYSLAGHIKKQYEIYPSDAFYSYISLLTELHNNQFHSIKECTILDKHLPYGLSKTWVNFQEKYEFNPPHNHSGLLSFVLWYKIPYDLNKELEYFPNKPTNSDASLFGFLTSTITGSLNVQYLPISKKFEGIICMFPSQLFHFVNPFYTSNDFRISISGNVKILV